MGTTVTSPTRGDHGEGRIVGVHHHDRGDARSYRRPRETVVRDNQVDRPGLPQYIPHWLGLWVWKRLAPSPRVATWPAQSSETPFR